MTDDIKNNSSEQSSENHTPKWFIDEGIPGTGERPNWLPDKFKTAADMAKSYGELEKKFGSAPDEYDFSKSRYIDPEYSPFIELKQMAKEKRVPQEVMDKMVDSFDKYLDEWKIDENEEISKLGENSKERLDILDNWAKSNLSDESYKSLTSSLRTAESIKALEEIRGKMMSTTMPQVPNGNDSGSNNVVSIEDLQKELSDNFEKYKTDLSYRKDIQSRIEKAAKNSGSFIDKVGY